MKILVILLLALLVLCGIRMVNQAIYIRECEQTISVLADFIKETNQRELVLTESYFYLLSACSENSKLIDASYLP